MCRVRFRLTGIYFDTLEPSRPREEFSQPLIVAIPPKAHNKQDQGIAGLEAIDDGEIKRKAVNAMASSNNEEEGIETPNDSSSSSSGDQACCHSAENAQTNHQSVDSNGIRNSLSPSPPSSLPSSSSAPSSAPSSDEDYVHKPANKKISAQASKLPKTVNSRTTQSYKDRTPKGHTYAPCRGLVKPPPAKRVRFAMDVQKRIIPSDDASDTSSSRSSDDSYTDPPSPTEPYDAFVGYYHIPGASKFHHGNEKFGGSRMRFPAKVGGDADGADGFLDSEDGSEVDVQGLPVKGCPPRTVPDAGTRQSADQRHHQLNSPPLAASKNSGIVMDQSQVAAGAHKSNTDDGLHLEQSHVSQFMSPLPLGEQLRYPKLRSGKNLPEPIFVVRPRFLSHAKEKGRPADMLSSSDQSKGVSKNGNNGTKTSPRRPTRVRAPRDKENPKFRPSSLSGDLNSDVEFDEDVGILIRDV